MATYTKRGDSWRAQVYRNGSRHSRTFNTKAEARAWAEVFEEELDKGHRPGRHTFGDAVRVFVDEVTPKRRGERWESIRLNSLAESFPELMAVRMEDLTATPFIEWRRKRERKVSPATILRELNLIQSICEHARIELQWIRTNPVKDVPRPPTPKPRKRRVAHGEEARIVEALGWGGGVAGNVSQRVAVAFLFAIETAMRSGEICSLTWDQVHAKHVHLSKTKNGDERDVPLSARARELLTFLPRDADSVFNVTDGTRDALFRKALKAAKITGLHFHDTRREATSRLSKKLGVLELARVTGHRNISQLMTYFQTPADELADKLD